MKSEKRIGLEFAFIRVHLRLLFVALLPVIAGVTLAQGGKPKPTANAPTYARDLRPLLKARCVVCHNQGTVDNEAVSGGLALDSYAALKKGVVGKTPRFIFTAGHSAESELIKRLTASSPSKLMPKGGPPLPPQQIALFKKWIDAGAPAGDLSKEKGPASVGPDALPMPSNPGLQDVPIPIRIQPTADLFKKDTPKDAALAFALKIGPLEKITALAYSPDGKRLAVGGYRAVTLWDTTTGQPVACLTHLAGQVESLAFRPDGTQLAVAGGVAGASGEARVFDAKTFVPVGTPLPGHTDTVYSVAWSADGTRLATGSQDKTARIWEWPSGKELFVLRDNGDAVTRVCFTPDGKNLYTASQDRNLRRFDATNGKLIRVFSGHGDSVTALALSPDGKGLVSSGLEPRVRWWNPDNGDTTRYSDGHNVAVNDIVFSKDGKTLASAGGDKVIRLWDAGNAGQKRALEGSGDWLYAVALSPDGKFAAGAGAEGIARLWETENGRLRLSLLAWPPVGKATTPEWAAITPEGYFDASPGWAAKLRPLLAGKPVQAPALATFLPTLRQPESVLKSWQGAALEPAKLPPPPAPPQKQPAAPPSNKPAPSAKPGKS